MPSVDAGDPFQGLARARVAVVVVGFGADPGLLDCLLSVVAQTRDDDEVILVDNGIRLPEGALAALARVRIVGDGTNLGFAGGADLGAATSTAEVLVFVNSDAVVRPGALDAFAATLEEPSVGIATGSLRLKDDPQLVNSAGNPVHYLGITWAGGYGEPVERHTAAMDVASATGAFFAIRASLWRQLGGFDPSYFMYHEDTDLSLRCWLSGHRVRYCPAATATHDYAFDKGLRKLHLLERNRLTTVLTTYPTPLLARVAPVLAVTEPFLLVLAVRDGWWREKIRGWRWLAGHAPALIQRRRRVQRAVVDRNALIAVLTGRLEQTALRPPPGMALANAALDLYGRRVVGVGSRTGLGT